MGVQYFLVSKNHDRFFKNYFPEKIFEKSKFQVLQKKVQFFNMMMIDFSEKIYEKFINSKLNILYDNRDIGVGSKFSDNDLTSDTNEYLLFLL